jgi:signal transduction histidine kinase
MRRRITYFAVLLVLLQTSIASLYAQYTDYRSHYQTIDSLEHILKTGLPAGMDLLLIYRNLAWGSLGNDHERVKHYSLKGIPLAQQLNNTKAESFFHSWLGIAYYHETRYDSALVHYNHALEAAAQMRTSVNSAGNPYPETDIDDRLAFTYGDIGNVYNIQGKYHQAVEYYMKALEIFEKHGWKEPIFNVYGNIGEMYLGMDNLERAEENALKASVIAHEIEDSVRIASSKERLSRIYLQKRDYDKALQSALIAHGYYFAHPEQESRISVLNTLGIIYLDGFNDEEETEKYVRQALEAVDIMNLSREKAISLRLLTAIHIKRGEWRKAEQAALEALAVDNTEPVNTMILYRYLSKIYAHFGNADKSGEYFDRHNALQASYSNKHYQSALTEMEVRYETEKKETRIATLEDEKQLMTWLSIAGGGILLLALIALFFLWRWTVQKKRLSEQKELLSGQKINQLEQEKQLIATQAVLDGEVQERARLARDLHDGLGSLGSILAAAKYNLADIKKASGMKPAEIDCFDKTVSLLDDSMREMRRVAHHLMPESLSNSGLKQSIADFCNSVPNVKFTYYGDETRLDPKMEVMVYRIMHELVSNALKHSGAAHILVEIARDDDNLYLTVQDDGCGFDPSAATKGMGLSNIRMRVAVIGGSLQIDSKPEVGTEINIELPITNRFTDYGK